MANNKPTADITPTESEVRLAADEFRNSELKLAQLDAAYKKGLAELSAKHDQLCKPYKDMNEAARVTITDYCTAKRDEMLDGKAKTADLFGLKVCWKKTAASLVLASKKTTWEEVANRLANVKEWAHLVRTKTEADKTALKKADPSILSAVGVKLESSENFMVTL